VDKEVQRAGNSN